MQKVLRCADLSADDRAAIAALSAAVYPPDEWKDWPGRLLEWANAEWCVCVWSPDNTLVSYTGIFLRPAIVNGDAMHIGGVGSIKTHPTARGRGYARLGIEHALRFFEEQNDVAFALLVCEPERLPYYARLG